MGVQMLRPRPRHPSAKEARFGEVDQVPKSPAIGLPAQAHGEACRSGESKRRSDRAADQRGEQRQWAGFEHRPRPLSLREVRFVNQVGKLAQTEPLDLHTQPLKGANLAPNEAVARRRVLIDEIGDLHVWLTEVRSAPPAAARLYSMSCLGRPRRR